MLYEHITDLIGNTPLVRIPSLPGSCYAKLEYFNPGGSIKDRSAWYMITQAEQRGELRPGGTIIEASSGNQGISAAYIGATRGYKVIVTVSEKVSAEKKAALQAYGAEIILCPATTVLTAPHSYYNVALRIYKDTPNSFMLNQYFNYDNTRAHYTLLGPELWRQTEGKITHFIAGAGSGGTISGAGRYLKEQNPTLQVIAVDTATSYRTTNGFPQPYVIEGLGVDYDTPLLESEVIDEFIPVADSDALTMLRTLAKSYGFLVGPASGAVAYAALQKAINLPKDALVVMLFGDSGRSYLTKQFFVAPSHEHTAPGVEQSSPRRENPVSGL